MSRLPEPSWRRYLTFWRPAVDRDVDAEIRFHLEERVADLMARGRTETQARAEAEAEFGDRATYRDRLREIDHRMQARRNRAEWLDMLATDVRMSFRAMRRAPGLTIAVITTLALGIGANGAVFSLLDRLLLRPPAGVTAPHELRRLYGDYKAPPPMKGFISGAFNYPELMDIREGVGPRQPIAGFETDKVRLGTADEARLANVSDVVGDYFGILGARPHLGRFFGAEELDVTTPHLVAVVSHRFWTRWLGADSAIIGKAIPIDRRQFTVIGVAPAGFDGVDLDAVEIWRPANEMSTGTSRWYEERNGGSIQLVTRIPPAVDERRLTELANMGLHRSNDRSAQRTTVLFGSVVGDRGPGSDLREASISKRLAGVTLIVLLIAIANVANLLLTRAIERQREVAVRTALGVSRARLAAHMITESVVLAIMAGAVATAVSTWGAMLIRKLLLPDVNWGSGPFDARLALFTFGTAMVAGLIASGLPMMRTSRFDLVAAMRGGMRDGAHRSRARAGLIIAQAALSVVLLAGAALFLRSLQAVRNLDLGYDPQATILATASSGQRTITAVERGAALFAIRDRIARLPGVREAALTNMPPMGGFAADAVYVPGRDSMPKSTEGPPTFLAVTPTFFKATGISIVRGRSFTPADGNGAQKVMIVTEPTARFIWGKADVVGQCVMLGSRTAPCTTVIGVTEDVRRDRVIEGPVLQYFVPLAQAENGRETPRSLVVGADPIAVERLRSELRSIMLQTLPGSRTSVVTLAERLEPQYRPWRIGASLFTAFGILALLVAAIGVYSAIGFAVTQRSHELGVRMALGAQRAEIGRIVISSGVKLVGIGVLLGVGISLALSRLIESLLYGTDSRDPAVLTGVAGVLLAVAFVAAAIPAWRAVRLDPVRALRAE